MDAIKYLNKNAEGKKSQCQTSVEQRSSALRRTSRFGGLPDLYSFYCLAGDEWHVEEGNAVADQPHRHGEGCGCLIALAATSARMYGADEPGRGTQK